MKKHTLSNWAFKNIPLWAKWGSILYAVRADRLTTREALTLWAQARRDFVPGKSGIFDWDKSVSGDFFTLVAEKEYREGEERRCVNGNCVEFWYRGRMNGGFGPVGCGCS